MGGEARGGAAGARPEVAVSGSTPVVDRARASGAPRAACGASPGVKQCRRGSEVVSDDPTFSRATPR